MLNPRILVALFDLPDAETLLDVILSALAHAGRPYGLRFAVPRHFETALRETDLPHGTFAAGDLKFFSGERDLSAIAALVTDETHFLSLRGAYEFSEKWEGVLLSRFAKANAPLSLMTAVIDGKEASAQACLPAFTGAITAESACLGAGLPLVCSLAPVLTLAVHPAFVFGKVDFLTRTDTSFDTLSIAAYAAGYTVVALDRAPLWPVGRKRRVARLSRPGPEALPPTGLARYEQLAGISFDQGVVSVRATQGLFGVEDGYPQRLPVRLGLSQRARTLNRRETPSVPLAVTAFIDLPEALLPPQRYLLSFSYLKALHRLPLTLYAGGEMERRLRAGFPNTLAYPDHSLLPRALLAEGITPMQLFKRNKLPLLQRSLHSHPSYSHAVWLDIDVLPHPVCPQTELDFSGLIDERVHIGWVNGEPDASMLVVPGCRLKKLVDETQAVTQLDSVMKRSYSEASLYRRLIDKYPDFFTLHPLPRKGLLFLTCLDRSLLSVPLRQALDSLPDPIRVPPGAPKKESAAHE